MGNARPGNALDTHEEWVRAELEQILGVPVTQNDDGTENAMPDLKIEYRDGTHAGVEIVRDILQPRAKQEQALATRGDFLSVPGLQRSWAVNLTPTASIRSVYTVLPPLLLDAEKAGVSTIQALQYTGFPLEYRLAKLRIRMAWSTARANGDTGVHLLRTNSCSWNGDMNLVAAWCSAMFHQTPDVPAKLAASRFKERHAIYIPTAYGDLIAHRALRSPSCEPFTDASLSLPTEPPVMPPGVEYVWAWGAERKLSWSESTGWEDRAI